MSSYSKIIYIFIVTKTNVSHWGFHHITHRIESITCITKYIYHTNIGCELESYSLPFITTTFVHSWTTKRNYRGEFIVPPFKLFTKPRGEIHAINRTQVFLVCYPDLILPKTHLCHWKSLISWTINHLRVNANIVDRSIGGWQPIWLAG